MRDPKVSVIIPVYNAEKYLQECLNSVLNQTLRDIEIICVDDGSTDSSANILADYARQDERVAVLHQENQYAGVARNNGMQIAKGEYITFLDADDRFEANMLERLYNYAKELDLDVTVCRSDRFYADKTEKITWAIKEKILPKEKVFRGQDIEKDFFRAFIWWPWDKLYKKAYIDSLNIKFQPLRTTNDLYFVCVAVLMTGKMSYIDDVLVHQRGNIESSLSKTREKSYNNFYLALLELRKFLIEHNLYERYEQDFVNYCLSFSLWHLDTMKGKSYCLLYNALRKEWYNDLKVTGHSVDYFYDIHWYKRLSNILNEDLETHLVNRFDDIKEKLKNTEDKLNKINIRLKVNENKLRDTDIILKNAEKRLKDADKGFKDSEKRFKDSEKRFKDSEKRFKSTENKLKATEIQLKKSLSRERDLKNSLSFRIGRTITWGPRKVRGGVQCYKQHGASYTIKRLGWHITHLK